VSLSLNHDPSGLSGLLGSTVGWGPAVVQVVLGRALKDALRRYKRGLGVPVVPQGANPDTETTPVKGHQEAT
jgi:hypothetical protein